MEATVALPGSVASASVALPEEPAEVMAARQGTVA